MDPSAGMGTPGNRADAILARAKESEQFRREMEEFLSKAPAKALSTLGGRDIARLSRFFGRRVSDRLHAYVRAFPERVDWQRVSDETSAEYAFLDHAFFRDLLRDTVRAAPGSENAAVQAAEMGDVSSLKVLLRIGFVTFPDEELIRAATRSIESLRYLHEAGYDTAEALAYAFDNGNVETARYAHDVIGQRLESHMKVYADFLPNPKLKDHPELQRLFNDNIHEVAVGILRDENEYYRDAIEIWRAEGGHAGALRKAAHGVEQNERLLVALADLDALIIDMEAASDPRAADLRARRMRLSTQLVKDNYRLPEIDPDEPFDMADVPPHQRLFRPSHTTSLVQRSDGRPLPPLERLYLERAQDLDWPNTTGNLQRADSMQTPWGIDSTDEPLGTVTSTIAPEAAHQTSWRPFRL